MKHYYFFFLLGALLWNIQVAHAGKVTPQEQDTLKTHLIDEVIITSSPKETNDLRKLPGAISIISPQAIAGRQIESLKDVSSFVPNLYIPDYGSKLTSAIYIRGVGARSSGQSVGLYVDNVPYLDKSSFDFELTGIQRIEVLRGPQGVLYGRNAMGGIIHIHTLSPFVFQGTRLLVSGGNYGQFKAQASHYRKLTDDIAFSVGGYYDRNDGFFTNRFTGKKADREESAGGRFKLDWHITPDFTAAYSLTADYVDQGAFPYGKYDAEKDIVQPVNINDTCSYNRKMLTNHLSLEYKTDRFVLTGTTGFQWLKDDMRMDQDYDTISKFILNQKQLQRAFSEEIAIKSPSPHGEELGWGWSFGLYGFYNYLHTDGPVTFKKDGIGLLQSVFDRIKEENPKMPVSLKVMDEELYIPGSFATPSYGVALFHQSTLGNLWLEGLSLTLGARLDYEKQRMQYNSKAKMKLGAQFPGGPVMDLSNSYDATVIDIDVSQNFLQALPKVALRYECTPRTFAYLSAAKGYKAGGYNVQLSADVMQTQMQYDMMYAFKDMIPGELQKPAPIEEVAAYKPEQSWNYELGLHTSLLQNKLSAELALYYMDISDIQLTKFADSGNGRFLTNAGKAQSYGAELSLFAQAAPGLTLDANYGYTHATFRDYDNGLENFKGKYVPYIPRHTLSLGLHYAKPFRNAFLDLFTVSAQYSGAGEIYWTERNDISHRFYGVINTKVAISKGVATFGIWARNLTDARYPLFYFESSGNAFIQLGKPLQAGAQLSLTF